MLVLPPGSPRFARPRSDSVGSAVSQGSRSKMLLRQRVTQLLARVEDLSSEDEEASEEVSRSLDEAFQLCGCFVPTDGFRCWTHREEKEEEEEEEEQEDDETHVVYIVEAHTHTDTHSHTHIHATSGCGRGKCVCLDTQTHTPSLTHSHTSRQKRVDL